MLEAGPKQDGSGQSEPGQPGSRRDFLRGLRSQPGLLVVLVCVGGLALLLAGAWMIRATLGGGSVVETFAPEPVIRVRIMRNVAEVVIGEAPRIEVGIANGETILMAAPVAIRWAEGSFRATDAEGNSHEWTQREVWFSPADGDDSSGASGMTDAPKVGPLRIGSRHYPGRVRLVAKDEGFDVVNDTSIDEYLPGVIAKELFSHWHAEAYRVQAICARGYALHILEQNASSSRHFDINAGEAAQTYMGIADSAKAIEAVRSTRGQVLVYKGELIRSYYSSTCGGRSGSAADLWLFEGRYAFNAVMPLDAHDRPIACEDAPLFRWSRTRSVGELSKRLAAFGINRKRNIGKLGRITGIEVIERAVTGRPARYAVADASRETFEISAEDLRIACNFPARRLDRPDIDDRVMSNDLDFSVRGDVIEIVGRGFGHGVGMCQYCANALAERGVSVETMLGQFFHGATIERWFE